MTEFVLQKPPVSEPSNHKDRISSRNWKKSHPCVPLNSLLKGKSLRILSERSPEEAAT
jgi:hypothetical protein